MTDNPSRPNLDLLRSLAVGLVVLSHTAPLIGGKALMESFNFGTFGRMGVALFFVHTTLVLMMSLERHGPAALPFFVRRFFRIYPLAIAAVLVVLAGRLRTGAPVLFPEVAANMLLIQNFTGHVSMPDQLWTLPFEVQMYLFLPALYAVTLGAHAVLRVALICGGSLAIGFALFYTVWKGGNHLLTPFHYIPCFLPGVLAFVLSKRHAGTWSPLLLVGFVAVAAQCWRRRSTGVLGAVLAARLASARVPAAHVCPSCSHSQYCRDLLLRHLPDPYPCAVARIRRNGCLRPPGAVGRRIADAGRHALRGLPPDRAAWHQDRAQANR
jgi:peptidoglycan/LPS O-acetylase OafA/YrhL